MPSNFDEIAMIMRGLARLLALAVAFHTAFAATEQQYSVWMAKSIMSRRQGIMTGAGGSSELLQAGIVQKAFTQVVEQYAYDASKDTSSIQAYIKSSADSVVPFLSNATADAAKYPLDRFSNGNALLTYSFSLGNSSTTESLQALRHSLDFQPRNEEGGLWYFVYPYWSYLDGMYSYAPFYSLYTSTLDAKNTTTAAEDIMLQLDLLWDHCFNNATGLLVHGYDASKTAVWADPQSGASPHVWGRSLGWYAMALVDTLSILPSTIEWEVLRQNIRKKVLDLFPVIAHAADPSTGAWWQVMDHPGDESNYIESSAGAMFSYALLKAIRMDLLPTRDVEPDETLPPAAREVAVRAYEYIKNTFVLDNGNGTLSYNGTVSVCSLNSTASYEYYVNQPLLFDSVLGSASFVMASLEVERVTMKGGK